MNSIYSNTKLMFKTLRYLAEADFDHADGGDVDAGVFEFNAIH